MSGLSQPDPVRQLLGVLSDPAAYKKQIETYAAAKEDAETAVARLNDTRQILEFEKGKHGDAVERLNARAADFESTKVRVLAAEQNLASRETALSMRELTINGLEKRLAQQKIDWEKQQGAKQAELDAREKAVSELEEQLTELQIKLADKKNLLSNKLAKLREIAG